MFFNLRTSDLELIGRTKEVRNIKSLHLMAESLGVDNLLNQVTCSLESTI